MNTLPGFHDPGCVRPVTDTVRAHQELVPLDYLPNPSPEQLRAVARYPTNILNVLRTHNVDPDVRERLQARWKRYNDKRRHQQSVV